MRAVTSAEPPQYGAVAPPARLAGAADMRLWVPVYAVLIAGAEILANYGSETAGAAFHAVLVLALLNHHLLLTRLPRPEGVPPPPGDVLLALVILPLLGAFSVALPLGEVDEIHQHTLIGLPFLLAIVQAMRVLRLHRVAIGARLRAGRTQAALAAAGIPLGLAGWLIAGDSEPIADFTAANLVLAVLILTALSALPEELALRGLLQSLLARTYGSRCILWSAALSAILYAGAYSVAFTAFAGAVALLYGWVVWTTRSIAGAVASHALLNVGLLMVWPELLG